MSFMGAAWTNAFNSDFSLLNATLTAFSSDFSLLYDSFVYLTVISKRQVV
jgi:hypothetical protein